MWDLNPDGAAETVSLIESEGGKAIAITADCADKAAIKAAADETRAKLGPVSILVNNAGIAPMKLGFAMPHMLRLKATMQPWGAQVTGADQTRLAK